jgi:phage gpG-like protein
MAGVVTWQVFGIRESIISLDRGQKALTNFSHPLDLVADDMYDIIRQNFMSEGRRGGGSWRAVRDKKTIRTRLSYMILIRTGRLFAAATGQSDEGKATIRPHQVTLRIKVPYAAVHQFGSNDSRNIPARPYIEFTEHDRDRFRSYMQDHLIQAMRGQVRARG